MEKETTYRKIAETRYIFTADDIFEALLAQHGIDLGYDYKFCIRDDYSGSHAQLTVKRTVGFDDSGPVMTAT